MRRQALRKWRKPLIILTPKSLLRHPRVVSSLAEFSDGQFAPVIRDERADPKRVTRVLICAGKIFYELDKKRREEKRDDVAIVRLEQLYPLPDKALRNALDATARGTPVFWVQEEPKNMGAWCYLNLTFKGNLWGHPCSVICRPAAASPATGWTGAHRDEQARLLAEAVGERETSASDSVGSAPKQTAHELLEEVEHAD
jgi:2-oxoglutarate dehydrogenase E1 component